MTGDTMLAAEKMLRFDELTRAELRDLAPQTTALVPLGSTEQHGPHLPVNTDTTIVSEIAVRAAGVAARQVPVVLLPTLPFGFAHHHLPFGGTVSINQESYSQVLTEIVRSLNVDGFRRVIFLNGHGGNVNSMAQAADRLAYELDIDLHIGAMSYWNVADTELQSLSLGPTPGHAGRFETSCMLAIRPDLVRLSALPAPEPLLQPLAAIDIPGGTVRNPGIWQASDGRTDDSDHADAALGVRALEIIVHKVSEFIVAFHGRTVSARDESMSGERISGSVR